ncbi:alpha/beta fold hydrolase [Hyphomicrobium sp. ghe19]|uniref:alpha/beta fold hydrolase n=1 Tax=Hyphomicrobium sp. ghe19 TaxID=2682968 RepID=UPI0013675402|nr:4,5:9,10-diseco-3-hydroxy-5,9, 17-trioxoandrosta-1(10),2-diene-4-oate hydrolase [Hyphomicrobium sp. ghe19]
MLGAWSAVLLACIAIGAWLWTPDISRTTLEAKYLNSPTDYLDVDGLRLHVRNSGPRGAPVVILLHGFGSSLHTWEPWARALADKYHVIRYDLPGFGLTGADPTGDYTEERGVHVLAALMEKLSIQRASLIGNSIGGRLVWHFAARYPGRVDKLVLISPDGFASPGYEYGKAPAVPLLARMMNYVLPRSFLKANLAPAYADLSRLSDATVDRYYELMLAPGVRGAMIARMEQTRLEPPEPLLKSIEAPTLLVWGEQDNLIPISNASDYMKALPHATLVRLPELGHVPQEEDPTSSLSPVRAFLDQ